MCHGDRVSEREGKSRTMRERKKKTPRLIIRERKNARKIRRSFMSSTAALLCGPEVFGPQNKGHKVCKTLARTSVIILMRVRVYGDTIPTT